MCVPLAVVGMHMPVQVSVRSAVTLVRGVRVVRIRGVPAAKAGIISMEQDAQNVQVSGQDVALAHRAVVQGAKADIFILMENAQVVLTSGDNALLVPVVNAQTVKKVGV